MNKFFITILFSLFFIPAIQGQHKINYRKLPIVDSAVGWASFYSDNFIGRKTANGEIFNQTKLTCAHNTLPFGTKIRVTNLENNKSVVVRVNDRLHHRNSRLVDLTTAAAKELKFKRKGVIKVKVEVIRSADKQISPPKE